MKKNIDCSLCVPIHSWAGHINAASLALLKRLAQSRHLRGPLAVMPDVHAAENVCVGTVLVTDDVVFPTAVGEDLGCGMCTQSYPLKARALTRRDLEVLLEKILDRVPVGRRTHREPQECPRELQHADLSNRALSHQRDFLGLRQYGTLGGGNHFIELQSDTAGRLWVTVHSGSRGIGAAIAAHHCRKATQEKPLPFMELGTAEADAFFTDLKWALAFAAANRRRMLDTVTSVLSEHCGAVLEATDFIDVPHNVITLETHAGFERALVVHRKGAMPAEAGQRGIIPGSMGSASYLVEGLGASASYRSCSHGAGRAMSRREAQERISLEQFRRQMRDVVYPKNVRIDALIDEAPSAYKNIKAVLAEQADLAKPLLRLEPLAVVKG